MPTIQFLSDLYKDLFEEAIRRNPDLLLTSGTGYNADSLDAVAIYWKNFLTDSEIEKLRRKAPFVFSLKLSRILALVNYIEGLVDCKDEAASRIVAGLVLNHPNIFSLSLENLAARVEYLKETCALQDSDLSRLLQSSSAAILGLSVHENLEPTLNLLLERLDSNGLRKIILAHPQLLGLSLENLKSKVGFFDELDAQRRLATRILLRAPAVYSLSIENIREKVQLLEGLWGSNQTSSFLGDDPTLLTLSLEGNIRPTINFYNRTSYIHLDEEWKRVTGIVLRPRYISASLFQRLLPRWHFALDRNDTPRIPLHILAMASDKAFCEYLAVSVEEYQEFKAEAAPRLKFSSQFDTWLKTGRPIDV